MTIDTISLIFLFAVLGALVWQAHAFHARAHARSQEIMRDIARCLGTDRREEVAMRHVGIFLLLAGALTGCTSSKAIYTSDGRHGYTIDCSAYRLTWSACFERASELCGARG